MHLHATTSSTVAADGCSTSGRGLIHCSSSMSRLQRGRRPGGALSPPRPACQAAAKRSAYCIVMAAGVQETPFPTDNDYNKAISQAQAAVRAALADGAQLMEVEFPTVSLAAVAGDGEGVNEMTASLRYLRQFLRGWQPQAASTRVFFPDEKEMQVAMRGRAMDPGAGSPGVEAVFEGAAFPLGYLTRPNAFSDMGLTIGKVNPAEQVKSEDKLLVAAYPYFNPGEMLAVEELYQQAVKGKDRAIIIFNGEIDRIRSSYYPPLFYPKVAKLTKTLLPQCTTAYYIKNFKGSRPGTLFRCYPGPWQVYRRGVGSAGGMVLVHSQEAMPSLKEVALDILPQSDKVLAAKMR